VKKRRFNRRRVLEGLAAATGIATLSGCDAVGESPTWRRVLETGEDINRVVQRFFLSPSSLAREYTEADIAPWFRPNGTTSPDGAEYRRLAANGFVDWRLEVGGLVDTPLDFSLADLRALPAREQITRHDCVEGWSCIGKWKGVQLARILEMAKLKPAARFILFRCADDLEQSTDGSGLYYETHSLEDAYHPQTILAYDLNGAPLPVANGAPLRLRTERTLGYKMAKYVMRIEAIDTFASLGRGRGSFWADRGYDWYAGI
jgi:DMSO/TMAO reductase YedYZ molybdopterin-dependent catalytic subunit